MLAGAGHILGQFKIQGSRSSGKTHNPRSSQGGGEGVEIILTLILNHVYIHQDYVVLLHRL
jgi:hypothetical protein